jgi:DNA-binding beta-propeller fold protein YncE
MRDRSFGVAQLLPLVLPWRQVAVAVPLSGDSFQAKEIHTIPTPGVRSWTSGIAVTHNGTSLLVSSGSHGGPHAIYAFSVANGSRLLTIGEKPGTGKLQFNQPHQVHIASDGFVFVADFSNDRVQVLTPRLAFHGYYGESILKRPIGVCANDSIVAVAEHADSRVAIFNRISGRFLHYIGSAGSGNGQLKNPRGLCFLPGDRQIAVVDDSNARVSVFDVNGTWIRHVGVGVLKAPTDVACSAFDELVVADTGNSKLRLFSASTGALLPKSFDTGGKFTGVAIHGNCVFAQDEDDEKCVVFS